MGSFVPEYTINESSDETSHEFQEYLDLIKQRTELVKEENARLEDMLGKLKLLNDEKRLLGIGVSAETLPKYMIELEAKNLSSDTVALSQAEKLRKQSNYLSKLKICIRHYINLNTTLSKEIKSLKSDLEQSNGSVNNILKLSTHDIQQLEEKAKKYENELINFERKYQWLKNSEYDLQNISKYIDTLNSLKEEKAILAKELEVYKNLKPDIKEAKQQLNELKEQMKLDRNNFKI